MIGESSGGDGKKGGALSVRRAEKGAQADVLESCLAPLDLPPEKQKLLWRGRAMADHELLWDLGVRADDEIELEFESPAMPHVLQVLRRPGPAKPAKSKDKSAKKKGGKKK